MISRHVHPCFLQTAHYACQKIALATLGAPAASALRGLCGRSSRQPDLLPEALPMTVALLHVQHHQPDRLWNAVHAMTQCMSTEAVTWTADKSAAEVKQQAGPVCLKTHATLCEHSHKQRLHRGTLSCICMHLQEQKAHHVQ